MPAASTTMEEAPIVKKRVLIADDNVEICEAIAVNIVDRYDVIFAHDGEEALRLALTGDVDVMVLDVMMPQLDGPGVLAELRDRGSCLRVILSSASHDLKAIARRLGVFDILPKPFGIDDVEEKLARAVALP
jgi:two-component system response regulator AdeR